MSAFVWKWGPLGVLSEKYHPQPEDAWYEPSPEFRSLLVAVREEVKVGPMWREPVAVYQELASNASAVVRMALQLEDGEPINSTCDLPPVFQQAVWQINGRVRRLFESDALTDMEKRQDVRYQLDEIYGYVNWWLRAAGVHPAIGRTDGGPYIAAVCHPDISFVNAWHAAREAGKPITHLRRNTNTGQVEEVPVLCPSVLSGQLACDVAAILIRPEGWKLCLCGNMFKRYGNQKYCNECPYKKEKRREENRQAKRRHDAKKRGHDGLLV